MFKKNKTSFFGFFLLITVGLIIAFSILHYFGIVRDSILIFRTEKQIIQLTKASYVWQQIQKQDDFSDEHRSYISLDKLIKSGLIKNTTRNTKNLWGGEIILQPGSNPQYIRITLTQLPQSPCQAIAKHMDKRSKLTKPRCDKLLNEYTGEF